MGLWFLLHTNYCNYCKRSDRQHSLLCSMCSASVLQWPQKMTSQYQTLPSYLQDTTDYLKKQEALGPIPSHALLVSMNVTSLYTNIPHSDGIKACEEAWEDRDIKDPPTQTLVKLLTLVLKCNNFEFNGQHYLQVQGTAMGTKIRRLNTLCPFGINKGD